MKIYLMTLMLVASSAFANIAQYHYDPSLSHFTCNDPKTTEISIAPLYYDASKHAFDFAQMTQGDPNKKCTFNANQQAVHCTFTHDNLAGVTDIILANLDAPNQQLVIKNFTATMKDSSHQHPDLTINCYGKMVMKQQT